MILFTLLIPTLSISNSSQCLAQSVYLNYPAIVSDRNVFGFQFHPELSQRSGSLLVSDSVILLNDSLSAYYWQDSSN